MWLNMKKIDVYMPAKENECLLFQNNSNYLEIVENLKSNNICEISFRLIENNKEVLTKLYNSILAKYRSNEYSVDYVIFMHSDVNFNIENFVKHLLSLEDKYDIIGLAGSKKINLKATPLSWFTASNDRSDERYGYIVSKFNGMDIPSFFNENHPNVTDTETASVDGLCMILSKKIIDSDIKFDEQFENDFYDLDFCLQSMLNYNFTVGTMIEPTYHTSVGESILGTKFLEFENKFREKWNLT